MSKSDDSPRSYSSDSSALSTPRSYQSDEASPKAVLDCATDKFKAAEYYSSSLSSSEEQPSPEVTWQRSVASTSERLNGPVIISGDVKSGFIVKSASLGNVPDTPVTPRRPRNIAITSSNNTVLRSSSASSWAGSVVPRDTGIPESRADVYKAYKANEEHGARLNTEREHFDMPKQRKQAVANSDKKKADECRPFFMACWINATEKQKMLKYPKNF